MHIEDRRKLTLKKFISTRGQERLFIHLLKCIVGVVNLFPLNHFTVIGPIYFGKPCGFFEEENNCKQRE